MSKKEDVYSAYSDMDDMLSGIETNMNSMEDEIVNIDELEGKNDEVLSFDEEVEIIDVNLEKTRELKLQINNNNNLEAITNLENKKHDEILSDEQINQNDDSKKDVKVKIKKVKSKKAKKNGHKLVITFGMFDLLAIVCLFVVYGPFNSFKNFWITSAMTTMKHQYLAYVFYSQDTIDKVIAGNQTTEVTDEVNQDDITISGQDTGVYESIYDEQVLKRDEGNDLYKVIDVEGKNYKGHLLVVYDASRVKMVETKAIKYGGKQLENLLKEKEAIAGTNASGFSVTSSGLVPTGIVISEGKAIWPGDANTVYQIAGFNNDNKLILTRSTTQEALNMGIRDAMSFGPFLIINGVPSTFKGNGGYGIAPRTAIGQRKDGIVLMLVIDGRRVGHSLGVDMVELTNILLKYGAYNASNLDGGGSSSIVVNNEVLSVAGGSGYSGERYLPNAWIVK